MVLIYQMINLRNQKLQISEETQTSSWSNFHGERNSSRFPKCSIHLLKEAKSAQPSKLVKWYVYHNIFHKALYYLHLKTYEETIQNAKYYQRKSQSKNKKIIILFFDYKEHNLKQYGNNNNKNNKQQQLQE